MQQGSLNSNINLNQIDSLGQSWSVNNLEQRSFSQNKWFLNRSINHSNLYGYSKSSLINNSINCAIKGYIWGTRFSIDEANYKINQFFISFKDEQNITYLDQILNSFRTQMKYCEIKASHLYEYDSLLYNYLVYYPSETIQIIDQIINKIAKENNQNQYILLSSICSLKKNHSIRELHSKEINHLISIKGIIVRTSSIYPDLQQGVFVCNNCQYEQEALVEFGRILEPNKCSSCQYRNSFQFDYQKSKYVSKQFIKLQESPSQVPIGTTPLNINLLCYGDMTDECRPGDQVEICGIFRVYSKRTQRHMNSSRSVFGQYIDVVSISSIQKNKILTENEDNLTQQRFIYEEIESFKKLSQREDIYNILVSSLCPSMHGLYDLKLGLLCQLFGGVSKNLKDSLGLTYWSEINILLMGDPSTAKSQILSLINRVSPWGIYTSGKGSSTVGLTAYISRDLETREIILESGALVLSDKGICCIDEFDKLDQQTQTVLHESMEQQTISIAKQGIVCQLRTRTAVLAAANPKDSRYNTNWSLVYNLSMDPALISRFDLIYLLIDFEQEEKDRLLGQHILDLYNGQIKSQEKLSIEYLCKYIEYARMNSKPVISDEAEKEIVKSYLQMRAVGSSRKIVTATPRQIESLVRLSEALAKMRLGTQVTKLDVIKAYELINKATNQAAIDPSTGIVDMNLLSTGFSSLTKERLLYIRSILQIVFENQQEIYRKGVSFLNLVKEVETFANKDQNKIENEELIWVLRAFEEEQVIHIMGNMQTNNFSIKLLQFQ